MEREKIVLTGAPETMLATLYGRALDSRAPRPVLGDRAAAEAVERIEYDFSRTGIDAATAAGVALRTRILDGWTREFLARHDGRATVLHLACGLDTRVQRLDPPAAVRWIDLDHADVLALRERLLPAREGDYRAVAASVTDDGWLDEVPADRPVVAVFEGLSMYLHEQEGRRLVERLTGRVGSGELLFDCYSSLGVRMQRFVPAVRNAGATLHWGIDEPRELEAWHPGLRLVDAVRSVELPGVEEFPRRGRIRMRMLSLIPGLRDVGRLLRYRW